MSDTDTDDVSATEAQLAVETLDSLIQYMKLKSDAALSRMLEVAPPVISKIRHGRIPFGASLIIRAHEVTGLSIRSLKEQLGMKCLERVVD